MFKKLLTDLKIAISGGQQTNGDLNVHQWGQGISQCDAAETNVVIIPNS